MDKAGNLWFGTTFDGVYYFDGKSFINFTTKDGLNSNRVYSILEDKDGNIWFGTNGGVCRYDGNTITDFPIDGYIGGAGAMLQDKNGTMWFGTSNGVYCYNGNSFTHFLENDIVVNKKGLHLKYVDCMLEDKNGNIWFGSGMQGQEAICRYDGKSITNFKPNDDVWICNMVEDKVGNIWFSGRNHGYFRYDGKTFTDFTEKIGFSPRIDTLETLCLTEKVGFGPVLEDKIGNIWFTGIEIRLGGDGGIWSYDGESCSNLTTKEGFGDNLAWCMVEDREGNIWIGTQNTGLYKFDGKTITCFSE